MKQRKRIYYTEEQKSLMWDRWQQGETLGSIARLFDRYHSSIEGIISRVDTDCLLPVLNRLLSHF